MDEIKVIKEQMIKMKQLGFSDLYDFEIIKVFAVENGFKELSNCIDNRLMDYFTYVVELTK